MRILEWALSLFFASIGVSLLTLNIIFLFMAYKLLNPLITPRLPTAQVVYDDEAEYYIENIDWSKSTKVDNV